MVVGVKICSSIFNQLIIVDWHNNMPDLSATVQVEFGVDGVLPQVLALLLLQHHLEFLDLCHRLFLVGN